MWKLNEGSSPLARGTPVDGVEGIVNLGLIPARAGNTTSRRALSLPLWAHPRSRGEHGDFRVSGVITQGSSPLARGTQHLAFVAFHWSGLIPARAGNTGFSRKEPVPVPAHPRSRGEHTGNILMGVSDLGSSPLARGTPSSVGCEAAEGGLIPARAGNTQASGKAR